MQADIIIGSARKNLLEYTDGVVYKLPSFWIINAVFVIKQILVNSWHKFQSKFFVYKDVRVEREIRYI